MTEEQIATFRAKRLKEIMKEKGVGVVEAIKIFYPELYLKVNGPFRGVRFNPQC